MAVFSKECLDTLRQRIDLVEVLSSHMDLKRAGAAYKGLCPFHDEKTPSFMIQKGDTHYHCFGCGAHGDAIHFLMSHLRLSFADAVENLAQRFHVPLDYIEKNQEQKGPPKAALKEALEAACRFYHFMLLHTPEGHEVLHYLYQRGIDLDFIRQFQIGLAPRSSGILRKCLHVKFIKDETMEAAGLLAVGREGGWRDFFQERITFPIRDASGAVIGFSARKYREETFGGKYINTTETPLFKKSRVLFGLNYCRRRIAKEKRALIVEGQIDALRLIREGFTITVAGQGTAFGDGHVRELLNLGVAEVFLAMDADEAGQEATVKIGDFFQREGVEVHVIKMPPGSDPDSFIRERGADAFLDLMRASSDYLTFLVGHHSRTIDMKSPAGKNQLVQMLARRIREWNHPVMVQESLRKLAHLAQVTEEMVGAGNDYSPNLYIKQSASAGIQSIDPDLILETDFLRWLFLKGESHEHLMEIARQNVKPEDLKTESCRKLYQILLQSNERDLLNLAMQIEEGQLLITDLMHKIVNRDKAEEHFVATIKKMLERNWMHKREEVRMKIQSGLCSDDEALELVKQFDELKRSPPIVKIINHLNN